MEVLVWGRWCRAGEGGVVAGGGGGGGGGSEVPRNLACMRARTLAYKLRFWAELCIGPPRSRACSRREGGGENRRLLLPWWYRWGVGTEVLVPG